MSITPLNCVVALVFVVVFCSLGIALIMAMRRAKNSISKKLQALDEQTATREQIVSPDLPPQGAEQRIADQAYGKIKGLAGFTIFWNLFSWTIAIVIFKQEVLKNGNYVGLFVLLFPLVGILCVGVLIRALLRNSKFGRSELILESAPVVVGGTLSGNILTGVQTRLTPRGGFQVQLLCLRQEIHRSGRDRQVNLNEIWTAEATVQGQRRADDRRLLAVPIEFEIPHDATASSDSLMAENRILWRLEIKADLPGVDYYACFEIPVFREA